MTTSDLQQEYETVHEDTSRLLIGLRRRLGELFAGRSLTLGLPLEARVKEWSSILEKLDRKALNLPTIKALDDLVGIRGVFLFKRDLATAGTVVKNTFCVLSEEDTGNRLEETTFGYQSVHFVLRLPAPWLADPAFAGLGDFRAELQLRTLAQHIWASASHRLQYKHEKSVPKQIRRTIHRASALLETVDLEFERVLQERETYVDGLDAGADTPLNVDNLARMLDDLLPARNKSEEEPYADLLTDLTVFGITGTAALKELIGKQLAIAAATDAARAKQESERWNVSGRIKERADRGIFFGYVGLVRQMMAIAAPEKYEPIRTRHIEEGVDRARARGNRPASGPGPR